MSGNFKAFDLCCSTDGTISDLEKTKMFIPRPQGDISYKKREIRDKIDLGADLKWFPDDVKQSICSRLRENFNQYLLNTTLHGLKYVGDRKITRLERLVCWNKICKKNECIKMNSFSLFFVLMFVLVIIISAYFINNVWSRWNESPLVVTLNAYGSSVKDFPFPGIFSIFISLKQLQFHTFLQHFLFC